MKYSVLKELKELNNLIDNGADADAIYWACDSIWMTCRKCGWAFRLSQRTGHYYIQF